MEANAIGKAKGSETGGFSFYVHKIRVPSVALDKLQHLPAVGHLFRIGAVQRRTVDIQVNSVEVNLRKNICPGSGLMTLVRLFYFTSNS